MSKKRRLIYQLNVARHTMMKHMDAVCRQELGISMVQFSALMVIGEQKTCQMKDLARILMLDKSAITGLANRMLNNDLIIKQPSKLDARVMHINMTSKGQQLLAQGLGLLKKANVKMTEGFSEQELSTVSRYLTHLTTIFS